MNGVDNLDSDSGTSVSLPTGYGATSVSSIKDHRQSGNIQYRISLIDGKRYEKTRS